MPRAPRSALEAGIFHVTSRGARRAAICLDDVDYRALRDQIVDVTRRFEWELHGYCLMPNHYHLLVETEHEQLSRGMQRLNGLYAQHFNGRHDFVGHLFQGRYSAYVIKDEEHFSNAVTYLAYNPVNAGLCAAADDWPWAMRVYEVD
jgi:putative transposase